MKTLLTFALFLSSAVLYAENSPKPILIDTEYVNLVVFIPDTHAQQLREALAKAGAGKMGNYDSSSFSIEGTARFRPLEASNPTLGKLGGIEAAKEERIEVMCRREELQEMVKVVKAVHPYEKIGLHIYNVQELR